MPTPTIDSLDTLRLRVREFAAARAWDRYHTPKNLAMALSVEAAELVEPFQWLTAEKVARSTRKNSRPCARKSPTC